MRTSDHFLNYRHMKLIYLIDFRIIFPFIAYVKHFRKINTFMFIATFLHPVFQKTALSDAVEKVREKMRSGAVVFFVFGIRARWLNESKHFPVFPALFCVFGRIFSHFDPSFS